MDIQVILIVLYLLMFILLAVKFKFGLCLWLFLYFLNPNVATNLRFMSITANSMSLYLLLAYICHFGIKRMEFKPVAPFVALFGFCGALMIFGFNTPFDFQLKSFITQFCLYVVTAVIIYDYTKKSASNLNYVTYTLLIVGVIAVIYGFFLPNFDGFNPYWNIMKPLDMVKDYEISDGSDFHDDGRLFGRLSSVFSHPMVCGAFMILFFVFSLQLAKRNKWLSIIPIITFGYIVIAGVRSSLLVASIAFVIYLFNIYKKQKIKLFLLLLFFIIAIIMIPIPQQIVDLLASIDSSNNSNVEGSSIAMRLKQLEGCFVELKYCFLFGNGYNWTSFYIANFGVHPVILAFESIIFVVLCNWGVVGVFLWIKYWYEVFVINKKNLYIVLLCFSFLLYTVFTGLYDYMKLFMPIYVIMYNYNKINKINETKNYRILSSSVSSI